MSFNSYTLPTDSREEFCLALKAARESQGITLAAIAETTKIPADLFAALERCDLHRWPKGLFRRSFFRDYVGSIGVPVAEACRDFLRLFPDDSIAAPAEMDEVAEAGGRRTILAALARWINANGPSRTSLRIRLPK